MKSAKYLFSVTLSVLKTESLSQIPERIRALYLNSVPDEERIPFGNLDRTFGRGGELLSFSDGDDFVGFCYSFEHSGLVFLVYIATEPSLRGRGYGREILDILRSRKTGRTVFLVLEGSDSDDPSDMRVRRKAFYERCGCRDTGVRLLSDDVYFDSMFVLGSCPVDRLQTAVDYYEDVHNGRI